MALLKSHLQCMQRNARTTPLIHLAQMFHPLTSTVGHHLKTMYYKIMMQVSGAKGLLSLSLSAFVQTCIQNTSWVPTTLSLLVTSYSTASWCTTQRNTFYELTKSVTLELYSLFTLLLLQTVTSGFTLKASTHQSICNMYSLYFNLSVNF